MKALTSSWVLIYAKDCKASVLLANSWTISSVISLGNLFLKSAKSILGVAAIGSTLFAAVTSVATTVSSGEFVVSVVSPIIGLPNALSTLPPSAKLGTVMPPISAYCLAVDKTSKASWYFFWEALSFLPAYNLTSLWASWISIFIEANEAIANSLFASFSLVFPLTIISHASNSKAFLSFLLSGEANFLLTHDLTAVSCWFNFSPANSFDL